MLKVKRVYEKAETSDGTRFLVERLWPRGVKREALKMKGWLREVAPSNDLRRWFGHDPLKWNEFQKRYLAELGHNRDAWEPIVQAAKQGNVTLLYSTRDAEHNNALALKNFLENILQN